MESDGIPQKQVNLKIFPRNKWNNLIGFLRNKSQKNVWSPLTPDVLIYFIKLAVTIN